LDIPIPFDFLLLSGGGGTKIQWFGRGRVTWTTKKSVIKPRGVISVR